MVVGEVLPVPFTSYHSLFTFFLESIQVLEIRNLYASVDGNEILKGINLKVNKGEVHAIMGPNGSGKSTLAKVLAGHPSYEVTRGEVLFEGKILLELSPDVRAREGVFMAFQYPIEVPGVSNAQFLRLAYNEKQKHLGQEELDPLELEEKGYDWLKNGSVAAGAK